MGWDPGRDMSWKRAWDLTRDRGGDRRWNRNRDRPWARAELRPTKGRGRDRDHGPGVDAGRRVGRGVG